MEYEPMAQMPEAEFIEKLEQLADSAAAAMEDIRRKRFRSYRRCVRYMRREAERLDEAEQFGYGSLEVEEARAYFHDMQRRVRDRVGNEAYNRIRRIVIRTYGVQVPIC